MNCVLGPKLDDTVHNIIISPSFILTLRRQSNPKTLANYVIHAGRLFPQYKAMPVIEYLLKLAETDECKHITPLLKEISTFVNLNTISDWSTSKGRGTMLFHMIGGLNNIARLIAYYNSDRCSMIEYATKKTTQEKQYSKYLRVMIGLIEAGADGTIQCEDSNSVLCEAVIGNHIEIIKAIIKSSANVNIPALYKYSPIMQSVILRHCKITKLLIEAKAHPDGNIVSNDQCTPLQYVLRHRRDKTAKLLIDAKADIHKTINGNNVLSCVLGRPTWFKQFVDAGVAIQQNDNLGTIHNWVGSSKQYIEHTVEILTAD
jgi:hypothetical protein